MDGLTRLYGELAGSLVKYALGYAGELHAAEDIVSEAFLRAVRHMAIQHSLPTRAWFYKVVRNIALDAKRKSRWTQGGDIPEMADSSTDMNPEASIERREQLAELSGILDRLPENYRSVLTLREIGGLSYLEIAGVMDTSLENVKVLLFRARQKVRELYGRDD